MDLPYYWLGGLPKEANHRISDQEGMVKIPSCPILSWCSILSIFLFDKHSHCASYMADTAVCKLQVLDYLIFITTYVGTAIILVLQAKKLSIRKAKILKVRHLGSVSQDSDPGNMAFDYKGWITELWKTLLLAETWLHLCNLCTIGPNTYSSWILIGNIIFKLRKSFS